MNRIFITGISTDVGKTIIAAAVTEALHADYFKPMQTGAPPDSDAASVKDLISNEKSVVHPTGIELLEPASPHYAAALENKRFELSDIVFPETENHLVYEGAGGLLVPVNESETLADLIQPTDKIVLVIKHYLGSINHSLLSLSYLRSINNLPALIIFNGEPFESSEQAIKDRYPNLNYLHFPDLPTADLSLAQEELFEIKKILLG